MANGIVGLALTVRRLHDANSSGWWALLTLVPAVNILAGLIIGLQPSTVGENRFGPPVPKGSG